MTARFAIVPCPIDGRMHGVVPASRSALIDSTDRLGVDSGRGQSALNEAPDNASATGRARIHGAPSRPGKES